MKGYRYLLLLLSVNLLCSRTSAQESSRDIIPIFKNITIAEGLSNNEVKQIVEDSHGFTWFATGSGIDRYDGYRIKPFSPDGLDQNQLERLSWRPLKLIIDSLDNFYIASDFAGLQIYNRLTEKLIHLDHSNSDLISDAIFEISKDQNGQIWLATGEGIGYFDIRNQKINLLDSISGNVSRVIHGENGIVWFISENNGLCVYDGKSIQPVESFSSQNVECLLPLTSDLILIAVENTIFSYNPQLKKKSAFFDLPKPVHISEILIDKRNNVWIGTYNHGLFHFNPGTKNVYHFQHHTGNNQSIISDHISTLFEDRHDNIWIGSYGDGISVISEYFDRIQMYFQENPSTSAGNSIRQVVSTKNSLWYDNHEMLFKISLEEIGTTVPKKITSICPGIINAIAPFNEDVLIATDCGLVKVTKTGKQSLAFPFIDPNIAKNITSINYYNSSIYVGTSHNDERGGLWIIDSTHHRTTHFIADGKPGSLVGNHITTSLVSTKGDLWVATWDDLNLFKPEQGFIQLESLISDCDCLRGGSSVITILEDHLGYIWFGRIDDGGLVVINPKTFENTCYRFSDGLPDNSVTTVIQDSNKNLWAGTYQGIAKIKYPTEPFSRAPLEVEIVGKSEGIPNVTIWTGAYARSTKTIYMGTRDGLVFFSENLNLTKESPEVIVSQVRSLSKSDKLVRSIEPVSQIIKFRPGEKILNIDFSISNHYQSEMVEYAYRFFNLEKEWTKLQNQNTVNFISLSPGKYDFQIRARLPNSEWSIPASVHWIITPAIYRRWWFLSLVFVLAMSIVYAIQQYRILQLRKMQEMREQISHDLHDDIGSALSNIEIISTMAIRQQQTDFKNIHQRIVQTARESNEALHQIVWNLNPSFDKLENLVPYLSGYASRILEDLDIELDLENKIETVDLKLDGARRKDLFLAYKEALNNISKHAKATRVRISFEISGKHFQIKIKDNGQGIQAEEIGLGNGLKNMDVRLDKWQGGASVTSQNGAGTVVVLQISIP